MGKRNYIIVGILILLFGAVVLIFSQIKPSHAPIQSPSVQKENRESDVITYAGTEGKTAQQLLLEKEKGKVDFDRSGMIIRINNLSADTVKHEYWAFYINGKMSSEGAATYVTKDTDKIEWKIEKY
jgi:hypothetical protein